MPATEVVPVVTDVSLPAGVAGPDPMSFDVRCFLVPHRGGVTLVDTGVQADAQPVADALTTVGAGWADLTDIILTHAHVDHCGGLVAVAAKAPSARIWAGSGESLPVVSRPADHGLLIRGLRIIATPGHTPGHLCALDEETGTVFAGDALGNQNGRLTLGPAMFITDQEEARHSLRRLAALQPSRMLFGHGQEVADAADGLLTFLAG